MTAQERERMERWIVENCGPNQFGERDENGVDLGLIRGNLELTPEQRLIRGDEARRGALQLREYGRQAEEKRRSQVR